MRSNFWTQISDTIDCRLCSQNSALEPHCQGLSIRLLQVFICSICEKYTAFRDERPRAPPLGRAQSRVRIPLCMTLSKLRDQYFFVVLAKKCVGTTLSRAFHPAIAGVHLLDMQEVLHFAMSAPRSGALRRAVRIPLFMTSHFLYQN